MPRDYSRMALPRTIPNWQLGFALQRIRPYWDKLPTPFLEKFNDAYNTPGKALVVTKADLDSLSEEMWQVLQANLS